jgi:epoxyqueuosine reductase
VTPADGRALAEEVIAVGRAAGLEAVGVTGSAPFLTTRRHLEERKAAGYHAGMAFTYRNPRRSTDPSATLPGARSLVVGAAAYLRRAGASPDHAPHGRVARYAWSDTYAPLRGALEAIAGYLRAGGYRARVVADDNALVDREAAVRAGLGWYGKNANVLLPGRGSWFVLGSVISDALLVAPPQPLADGCGRCTCCLDGCPTKAIVAPGLVDARRCLAWLLQASGVFPIEYRVALGDRIYGCDDCQEVCPPNRVAVRLGPPDAGKDSRAFVSVLDLLALDDAALLAAAGSWYVPERDPRYLRRNLLIVLGNSGDGRDAAVVAALCAALADPDPIVRGHAVWAAARIGRPDLAAPLRATEADAVVRAELAAAPAVCPAAHGDPTVSEVGQR